MADDPGRFAYHPPPQEEMSTPAYQVPFVKIVPRIPANRGEPNQEE